MLSPNTVRAALRGHILSEELNFEPPPCFERVHLLDGGGADDGRLLYLGTPDAFVGAADNAGPGGRYTFLLAGSSPALEPYRKRPEFNLVCTALTLPALCNLIYRAQERRTRWQAEMERLLHAQPDLRELIACGAGELGGDACLLDAGCKLIFAVRDAARSPRFLEELEQRGYLASDYAEALTAAAEDGARWLRHELPGGAMRSALYPVLFSGEVVAHLLLVLPDGPPPDDEPEKIELLRRYIGEYMDKYEDRKYSAGSLLGALVDDLIERRVTDADELLDRLGQLAIRPKKYYYPVVVELDEPLSKMAHARLVAELEELFPGGAVTSYRGDILVLAWKDRHYIRLEFDEERLVERLEHYRAVACIGNFTSWLTSLRPLYLQTKGAIQYARVFREEPRQRLFRFEEFSMYQIVGLCADHAAAFHEDDLVYLSHPGIIALAKYDERHGSNLCLVLKHYMMNDRNKARTAKEFFFHRNTLQNKIATIERVIGDSLDNPRIRQRLMFSILVLEYIRDFEQQEIYSRKRRAPSTAELVVESEPAAPRAATL